MAEKNFLRIKMRDIRDKIVPGDAAEKLQKNFLHNIELAPDCAIALYYPTGSEIDVMPLTHNLAAAGFITCLPCVEKNKTLKFRAWQPGEPLIDNNYKILEPETSAQEVVPDIIVVPMLAFDSTKFRLGYGGGYYDRSLAKSKAVKIGVAYAEQEIYDLPHEEHDVALDYIVTEIGILIS